MWSAPWTGRIGAHLQSRPEGKGNHWAWDGDRTEASLVLTTVCLQTCLVWKAAPTGQRMPFSRPRLLRTHGPDRRRGHSWPPLALACPLWLWCGHCSDLSGLWQSHTVGARGCGEEGTDVGLDGRGLAITAPPCCCPGAGPEVLQPGDYLLARGSQATGRCPPCACPQWHSPAGAHSPLHAAGGSQFPPAPALSGTPAGKRAEASGVLGRTENRTLHKSKRR